MNRFRVIPSLLLNGSGLYKTRRFKEPKYIGDPINAVRIFNEKEVDELIFLDIAASQKNSEPNYGILKSIATECFMPLCYGGGIANLSQIEQILKIGVEKVALNTCLFESPTTVAHAAKSFGSSTIVVSIDFRRSLLGKNTAYYRCGTKSAGVTLLDAARKAVDLGAGELLINSIDRDGMQSGYDLDAIRAVTSAVPIPVIASGGAGSLSDFRAAVVEAGASAVAAGSFFVFVGKHRAVLITYPEQAKLLSEVYQ
jgi:cyclase